MATIILSAAGGALGGAIGGGIAGLGMATLGRAGGAMLGRALDQRLFSRALGGSAPVEIGRMNRLRIGSSSEGAGMARVYGRTRVAGQVIWATRFKETVRTSTTTSGGGKGTSPSHETKTSKYSYSISLAIALCEGEISRVGRIWADGAELDRSTLNYRVYRGAMNQLPDPLIEAIEGTGAVPAYRGTAYVVFEDLALAPFGNRVPQFSFEVVRPASEDAGDYGDIARDLTAVAMIPGTGEYALATTPVHYGAGQGRNISANVNSFSGVSDLESSVEALVQEAPNCRATSLVVSWFGSDLRCGSCQIQPKVEQSQHEGAGMPWRVSGLTRDLAEAVPQLDDGPVYGGTPTDQSVIEAIRHLNAMGQEVMFYPFILMDQLGDNGLTDPWTGADDQPPLPWRGRITLSVAPGQQGSPDCTSLADDEVAAFVGQASVADFALVDGQVVYSGPEEWSLRRFVLHNAMLCQAAGGVHAFCIGSELRGLTQIRGASGFPVVEALMALADDVRSILGPGVKLGYAADWSEYWGYQPQDGSGDRYFHLDPLWAHPQIDFVGIDNYMPLSDWRDEEGHADENWGSIYDLEYLKSNIEGGEGFDWYYPSEAARDRQQRAPITDGAYGEPWVYRYKDIRSWWTSHHHERIGGQRSQTSTAWEPFSKPIWFTEIGCAAVDKGTNQPNKFVDPKSSESALPYYSTGERDEFMQMQYLRVMREYWQDAGNNPVSPVYGGPMIDAERMFVWAWDARPYPAFPNHGTVWKDAPNYTRGHWVTGRSGHRSLASVVAELCASVGVTDVDTRQLYGVVRGYQEDGPQSVRAALQGLMMTHGFDAVEQGGVLVFRSRGASGVKLIDPEVVLAHDDGDIRRNRASDQEMPSAAQLSFAEADAGFEPVSVEVRAPWQSVQRPAASEVQAVLTKGEARQALDRWMSELRLGRETVSFALPPSRGDVVAGDLIAFETAPEVIYRVEHVTSDLEREIEAVRVDPSVYRPAPEVAEQAITAPFVPPMPALCLALDLPLLRGDEVPHAPYLAATADPWPGGVNVYRSRVDAGYQLAMTLEAQATIGNLATALAFALTGIEQKGETLEVDLVSGALTSVTEDAFLAGGNLIAIGDGTPDGWELLQFRNAEPLGGGRYALSGFLRGQAGTDRLIPDEWPVGSYVVLIDGALQQMDLPPETLGQPWFLRTGPVGRAYDDRSYETVEQTFSGQGLAPYRPCHSVCEVHGDAHLIGWVRRTRVGGDDWSRPEVPLAETSEQYLLRIYAQGTLVREATVNDPSFTYTQAMRAQDGAENGYRIEIAQVSDLFGAGPAISLYVDR
ncbi:host specificity protein [Donghicola sp. C2-DW-16]|uniref:Host specificity protein n=1 Tax=Donghicola mangrovi TaxID=2729614 RepID=A0ABX2PE65_9RHOB|nr:glycoside hydrolase/phage tail family protein [Donghicola mangrovi]NVO27777.1 host specificity protein [Donghicola mangrovi]